MDIKENQSESSQMMKLIENRTINVLLAAQVNTDGTVDVAYENKEFAYGANGWFEDNLFSIAYNYAYKLNVALTPISEGEEMPTAEVEEYDNGTIKIRTHVNGAKSAAAFDIVVYSGEQPTRDTKAAVGEPTLEISCKGLFNLPGVLWTGLISATGGVTKYYSNDKFSLSYEQLQSTSMYWLKYTNANGAQDLAVTATIISSDDNYGWTANVVSVDKSNNRIKVRTKRDNANYASAFYLTIYGNNKL